MMYKSVQHTSKKISTSESKNFFFQRKPAIDQPADVYEKDAGAVAGNAVNANTANSKNFFSAPGIQRKENKDSEAAAAQTQNYLSSLSGGKALNKEEKIFFEPRLGYNFSDVRLHTNNAANESAEKINALAYTHGNDIVFGSNQYQPSAEDGKKLLAHELTHVAQQNDKTKVYPKTYLEGESITDARTVDSESRVKEVILQTLSNTDSELYPYIKDRIQTFKDKANINIDDPDTFGHKYNRIYPGSKWKDKDVKENVQGFVDPKHPFNIYLYDRSKYCHAFHEAIHSLSNLNILLPFFGGFLNEGLTQYFTDIIFTEQIGHECKAHKYGDQLVYATKLVEFVGKDPIAKLFFTSSFSKELDNVAVMFGLKISTDLSKFKATRGIEKFLKEKYKLKADYTSED